VKLGVADELLQLISFSTLSGPLRAPDRIGLHMAAVAPCIFPTHFEEGSTSLDKSASQCRKTSLERRSWGFRPLAFDLQL
jgi:hypothetical protein